MCPDYNAFGITIDGAHSEYLRVPAAAIVQGNVSILPNSMSYEAASLIEPLSCVVHGSRSCRIQIADTVVVYGAGPIGLMHVMLANLSGAAKVIAVDVQASRLEEAVRCGADITIDNAHESAVERIHRETGNKGADVIITACPIAAVQEEAVTLLAPLGRVCLFGGLASSQKASLDTNLIHYKKLAVTGVTGGSPHDFRIAMKLIAAGRIDVERLISHRFAVGDMARAYDTALTGETMKVVIHA
jgi:L-iditol 2-dehydrogenase